MAPAWRNTCLYNTIKGYTVTHTESNTIKYMKMQVHFVYACTLTCVCMYACIQHRASCKVPVILVRF